MTEKEEIRTAYQGLVNVLIKSIKSSIETGDLDLCDEILAIAGEIMCNGAEDLVRTGIISEEQALGLNDRLLDMEVLFNAMKEEAEKTPEEQKMMEEDLGLS